MPKPVKEVSWSSGSAIADDIVEIITGAVDDHFKTVGKYDDLRFGSDVIVRDVVLLVVATYIELMNKSKVEASNKKTGPEEEGQSTNSEPAPSTSAYPGANRDR
jgi:hypothetical protein